MNNSLLKTIRQKSFEEFRDENSKTEIKDKRFNDSSCCYVTGPEYDYHLAFQKLPTKGGIYIAISGSINPAFGHISEIQPKLSILVDINSYAVDYLRLRGTLLEAASDERDYWDRLGRLCIPFPEVAKRVYDEAREMVKKSCNDKLPVELSDRVFEIIASEKIRRQREIECYHLRKQEQSPVQELQRDIGIGWSSPERYDRVKKAWEEGRIKGVTDDFTNGGFRLALDIADKSGVPITLVYISNISDYWTPEQRMNLASLIKQGFKRNLFHPQCRVIKWMRNSEYFLMPLLVQGNLKRALTGSTDDKTTVCPIEEFLADIDF